ncbi:unnamed protein product [Ceratitis capitata]|uniref:(Mediterranean fruit fly) hypothetical protein n=1 Tax=Ceratitis capitata TaxID=7213 RepID=A0A811UCI6_CERCA|nr:unnamed protein product [Ceratitis capitata]
MERVVECPNVDATRCKNTNLRADGEQRKTGNRVPPDVNIIISCRRAGNNKRIRVVVAKSLCRRANVETKMLASDAAAAAAVTSAVVSARPLKRLVVFVAC